MKKILAALLIVTLLLSIAAIGAAAYGESDKTLIVSHINYDPNTEGTAIIYTPAVGSTLAAKGTFSWCVAVVFDWDEKDDVYKVKSVNKAMNSDKSSTAIPANGFVYCINLGNNWPDLVSKDPAAYGGYAGKPNYVTERNTNSFNFAGSLAVGTTAYLYGGDLLNATVSNNGEFWYDDAFVSDTYIKIGTPDTGKTAYNPETASKANIKYEIKLNTIGSVTNEAASTILTRKNIGGISLGAKAGYTLDWWKTATFDWDEAQNCYVCVALNLVANGNAKKYSVIPENGFVYAVNLGNDYSGSGGINYINAIASSAFSTIESITIGSKAFLTGVDLEKNTIKTNGKTYFKSDFVTEACLYINQAGSGTLYTPSLSGARADKPQITAIEDAEKDYTISWSAVDGAEKYYVTLYDSSTVSEGKTVLLNAETAETSIKIDRSKLTVGYNYTVCVSALGNSLRESVAARETFYVYSPSAVNSPYRNKKIVAFGDSLTAITGWVNMLTGELGTSVINSGVGGDTTNNAIARLQNDVIAYEPDIVILNFGMNDQAVVQSSGKPNVSLEKYEENYRTIIEACKEINARIIMVTAHYVCTNSGFYTPGGYGLDYGQHDNWDKFVALQVSLAEEYKLERIPVNEYCLEVGLAKLCAPGDGIHLSSYGQECYTKWISEYLLENTDHSDGETSQNEQSSEESLVETSAETSVADNSTEASQSDESSISESSLSTDGEKSDSTVMWICICVFALCAIAVVAFLIIRKKSK